jgi:hypothetical protein
MFGLGSLLGDVAKAAVAVVTVPVALVTDTAEVVGLKNDSGKSHTGNALGAVVQNLENAIDPRK